MIWGWNDNVLDRWRRLYGRGERPSANGGTPSVAELEAELKRLWRENEILHQERDVLKKAFNIANRSKP